MPPFVFEAATAPAMMANQPRNSAIVAQSIATVLLSNFLLLSKVLYVEHALGGRWCVESNSLQIRVELKYQPLTMRGILSTMSSVFDPLGLLAPLILIAKKILQELCLDWAG